MLLMCAFPVMAQNEPAAPVEQSVTKLKIGLWQMMQAVPNEGGEGEHLIYLPVWKYYAGDGHFCTFLIASRDGASMMTMDGEYYEMSDSVYVEKVHRCVTEPKWQGQKFQIKYFIDRQGVMFAEFPSGENTAPHREIWRYVDMNKPREVPQYRKNEPRHKHKPGESRPEKPQQ